MREQQASIEDGNCICLLASHVACFNASHAHNHHHQSSVNKPWKR